MKNLVLTTSPHVQSKSQLQSIMFDVVIALLPATALSIYMFGWHAVILIVVTLATGLGFEWAVLKFKGDNNIGATLLDGSAIVTALLLALNLPPGSPVWMMVVGSFAAIVIAKHTFGGLGYNIFNPALVARVFLLISFPVQMTKWIKPEGFSSEVTTSATPLDQLKTEGLSAIDAITMKDFFMGNTAGSLGEMSAAALLIGAAYLFMRRVLTWEIPVTTLGALYIFTGLFHWANPEKYASPVIHLLSGGAILGAFYMATDMVTSPITRKGMIIFGVSIGIITGLIRLFGGYPEGISFAIIIMNAFVPLIDKYTKVKKFGT